MRQHMIKSTIRHMWPIKTQISLYIHSVWQGFSFISSLDSPEAVEGTCYQQRLWSYCADAQADLESSLVAQFILLVLSKAGSYKTLLFAYAMITYFAWHALILFYQWHNIQTGKLNSFWWIVLLKMLKCQTTVNVLISEHSIPYFYD